MELPHDAVSDEETFRVTDDDGIEHETVLVDEVVLEECVHETRAPDDE
jgi:hypothetical protein